jgi:hypothetical protein
MHRTFTLAAGVDVFLVKGCPAKKLLTAITDQSERQKKGREL